jgi:transcriptional regulator with XRE-family HTH domain
MEEEKINPIEESYENVFNNYIGRFKEITEDYFEKLKRDYFSANNQQRLVILGKLERIAHKLENKKEFTFNLKDEKNITYLDPVKTTKIRLDKGLSLNDLGKILNISPTGLSYYEVGKHLKLKRPSHNVKVYLNWLKENGYDVLNSEPLSEEERKAKLIERKEFVIKEGMKIRKRKIEG